METYREGMIALYICLTVLNLSIIGTAIYYVHRVSGRVKKDQEIDRIKISVLIESMTEIFESKYSEDEHRQKTDKGSIPRRD